jgi:hypothetical protein
VVGIETVLTCLWLKVVKKIFVQDGRKLKLVLDNTYVWLKAILENSICVVS